MEKVYYTDIRQCGTFISQNNWKEAAKVLRYLRDTDHLKSVSKDLVEVLKYVKSDYFSQEEEVSNFLIELFRYLRNAAITTETQNILGNHPFVLNEVKIIMQRVINQLDESILIKIILQFLINLVAANQSNCIKVTHILYQDILDCFYRRRNDYEVLALLYYLHLQNKALKFTEIHYDNVLSVLSEKDSEFAQFLSELFLYDESFWIYYDRLKISQRIIVLDLLRARWVEGKLKSLPEASLHILSKHFWSSENVIFQTISSADSSLEPYEVSLLLDILGSLCANEVYLQLLQRDKDLIIRCGVLLVNIHRLGQQSENYFSSIQKLSELREPSEIIQKHPAFGFKVGLVRLIGNLCWQNKKMQDLARETEIIPILLDCCNIDARNPLIMQWVILAIRNLCDKNLENQAIIAGLRKQGIVSSSLVEEMGLTLHDDENGGIRIVPLDLKK